MRVLAFTCGWLTSDLQLILAGEAGRVRLPVPCYAIEHPRGTVLFDSGLHAATQVDPVARLGTVVGGLFAVDFHPGEEVGARLAAVDIDPRSVRYLVNSHLHFDHTGGNAQIPNAELVVQRREWDAGHDADLSARLAFDRRDYDLGHRLRLLDGEHDLFGDGRVVCVPTYGHTPGHQSLRLRLDGGTTILLTADACYLRRTLERLHLPRYVYDRDAMLAVLHRIRAWEREGTRIFYGHDDEFWATVPQAPAELR
jgi:glyoxylase-like metal-dependent hydrolase (beta-lactamase superfamily II)